MSYHRVVPLAEPAIGASFLGKSSEECVATMGIKLVAIVLSNTNYTRNHLRALKAFRPEQRADSVAEALQVLAKPCV